MSVYSVVTEQDLINLRKLAEQQKNQRAEKIKNSFLKQTHDKKLAESLSPITKRFDDVKKSTEELGENIKKSQPNTNEPIENIEGSIYDVELENTLNKI